MGFNRNYINNLTFYLNKIEKYTKKHHKSRNILENKRKNEKISPKNTNLNNI